MARAAATRMIAHFHSEPGLSSDLSLPEKAPLPGPSQWSRAPGCYQLKSALAWWDVAEISGESFLRDAYLEMLEGAMATQSSFLPKAPYGHGVMDRLHAYCYFLEGLLPVLDRPECLKVYIDGIRSIGMLLMEIEPLFVRSDVYAQLLRARLYAVCDTTAAASEAEALAMFRAISDDPRVDGGFFFGRRDGQMSSHVNPVSTVFGLQALEMWRQHETGSKPPCLRMLI